MEEEEPVWNASEEVIEEPQPSVALSASLMAGIVGVRSMRLIGKIQGKELNFLVDLGAMHNFIDSTMAKRIRLLLQYMNTFEVEVADGEKMAGKFCYKATILQIQGFKFSVDL